MTAYESPEGLILTRPLNVRESSAAVAGYAAHVELLESRLGELELQIAEQGWTRLNGESGREFSRATLGDIVDLARVNYLKNPLIKRAVEIGALYVWGQDLSVNAADENVKAVVDRFWKGNRATLTGQQASRLMEVELQVTGNVFLALFPDFITGDVKVRSVPIEEIKQIVCNPEDRAEVWYYKRVWNEQQIGSDAVTAKTAFYPNWQYAAYGGSSRPPTVGDIEVRWESPILHVKAGAFTHWQWGVPEVYAALDWAKAYKEQLEDDATRSRALARFAWSLTTKGGKTGVAAAKAKLGTTYVGSSIGSRETNPPPLSGSTFIGTDGTDMSPIKIAGATLDPDHSRPARLMAAAATGIPDHFFDPALGNHATAKTMDRPTELRFNERRQLWRDVLTDLFQWVIDADISAAHGLLAKTIANDEKARKIDLAWPDILQPDTVARITSISTAATDAGNADAGNLPKALKARLYMQELGVDDIDDQLAELEKEQAEAEQKAAEIAKQMQPKAPLALTPGDPNQAPDPGKTDQLQPDPAKPTESLKESPPIAISDEDIADAVAWWDGRFPELKGVLAAPKKDA